MHLLSSSKVVLLGDVEVDLDMGALLGCRQTDALPKFLTILLDSKLYRAEHGVKRAALDSSDIEQAQLFYAIGLEALVRHQVVDVFWTEHQDVPLVAPPHITLIYTELQLVKEAHVAIVGKPGYCALLFNFFFLRWSARFLFFSQL